MSDMLTAFRRSLPHYTLAELDDDHRWWHSYAMDHLRLAKLYPNFMLDVASTRVRKYLSVQEVARLHWHEIVKRVGSLDPTPIEISAKKSRR